MTFRKSRTLLLVLSTICLSLNLFAQDENEVNAKRLEKQGDKLIENSQWEEAKGVFRQLLSMEPDNPEYNFYAGLAYFNSGIDKENSIRYFRRVRETEFPVVSLFLGKHTTTMVILKKQERL